MLNTHNKLSAAENIALKRSYKKVNVIISVLMLCCMLGFSALAANEQPIQLKAEIPSADAGDFFTTVVEMEEQQDELLQKLDAAKTMAESARKLGYAEDHAIILEAQRVYKETVAQCDELTLKINESFASMKVPFAVFTKSGITAEGFEKIVKDTGLKGHGQDFYDMEQAKGVNGLFAVAISRIESGMGVTNYSRTRNNHFGLIGKTFDDTRECIMYFGDLMNRSIYKGKTIEQIAKVYCPPNRTKWATNAYTFMNDAWNTMLKD